MLITQQSLISWQAKGVELSLLGHSIFTIDEGEHDLPVILLIHGFPTASWDWHLVWPTLSKQYRLVSLDMLGFGFSDKPTRHNYSIHEQADIIESLMAYLEIEEFHVLAHDYGDTVAQELLARQLNGTGQGHWLSCCLLNGGLFPETHRATRIQKLLLGPFGKLINFFTGFRQFSSSFGHVFGKESKPTQQALEEFWQLICYKNGKHTFTSLITYIHDRIEHRARWVSALQQSPVPMALINGSADPVSGQHMVARFQQLNCRSDYLKELPIIGHYPQVEAPEVVAQSYLEFLDSIVSYSK